MVDLGHVLRVPRRALEEMVGAELGDELPIEPEPSADSQPRRRANLSPIRTSDQLDIFETTDD